MASALHVTHETTRKRKGVPVGVKTDPEVLASWQRQGGRARRAPRRSQSRHWDAKRHSTHRQGRFQQNVHLRWLKPSRERGDGDRTETATGKWRGNCPAGILGAKHPSFPPEALPSSEGSWLEGNGARGPASRFYDLRVRPPSGVRI